MEKGLWMTKNEKVAEMLLLPVHFRLLGDYCKYIYVVEQIVLSILSKKFEEKCEKITVDGLKWREWV